MLKMSNAFAIRMAIWTLLVLYMAADFFLFNGPLKKELRDLFPTQLDEQSEAIAAGICAKVYNAPIYKGQVDRRIAENLWRNGRSIDKVSKNEFIMLRWAALNDLIDEHILRIKIRANEEQAPLSEEAIEAEVLKFEKRFENTGDLHEAMLAQGIESQKELRYRLAARLQQEKYVLSKIEPSIIVSEQVALAWYKQNKAKLIMPERRRVRHIFMATLDKDPDEVKRRMLIHLVQLEKKTISFKKLAAQVSEDQRSKNISGDLNWMTAQRVLPDFAEPVFSLQKNSPRLIQTKLGWHIVEVTEIKAPELLPYERLREEIIASLQDSRRKDAIKQYRHQLRLLNHKKIKIFKAVVEGR
ncbi:MAG: peptidylprolyl isomerase [Akkermansiaceae bacterium]